WAYHRLGLAPGPAPPPGAGPAALGGAAPAAAPRPEFPVKIEITREDGAVTGEMTVVWTLRPNA
ncbi:DUF4442 domain-containing protein, partial [Streptomyces sp. NPDC059810]